MEGTERHPALHPTLPPEVFPSYITREESRKKWSKKQRLLLHNQMHSSSSLPPTNASSWLDLELCLPLPQGVQPAVWIMEVLLCHGKLSPLSCFPACGGWKLMGMQALEPASHSGSCKCSLCLSVMPGSNQHHQWRRKAGIKSCFSSGPLPASRTYS